VPEARRDWLSNLRVFIEACPPTCMCPAGYRGSVGTTSFQVRGVCLRVFGLTGTVQACDLRAYSLMIIRLPMICRTRVVVPGPFDGAGAGAFTAGRDQQDGDIGQVFGELVSPVRKGECPPSRWRYGGSGAGPW
jgi:hypothetical protein